MAGRQLKEIFRAFHTRDELAFRRAAAEIIEEEQAKHHNALARDLQKLLIAGSGSVDTGPTVLVPPPPKDREGEWDLGEVREPERLLEDLVLRQSVSAVLESVIEEVRQWSLLDAAGLPRRQRLLLQGPPGCGKTTAAEAVAAELGRPLVIVRLDAVVSSYLGETASNLRRILEYADQAPFVVLFDEFDALGRSRDDSSEHGEMKRVVTAFLQMTERYRGPSLLLAATNHPTLLDEALWRRFDEVVTFDLPTVHQIRQLIRLRFKSVTHSGLEVDSYASALKGLPHAAAEKLVVDARRTALLRRAESVNDSDVRKALSSITSRPW
ncbi:AAA family ATPase (plasmid) [Mycobacterium sp. C3-094]|uniref:AAA family ATPase n=1 Tax=Mycobacterium sp. PSTR-4-N TaxID=2917745 RepID=UPI001F14C833|nr:ATP-binding protein [Mycobacterium sp. PSTR-4-N]MCG7594916.1 ATP-binding protein [Mycobacterium sp. PSTR-4-N]